MGIFGRIANAKHINKYANRLPVGEHRVVLTAYRVKESQQELGDIIEADFYVESTDVEDAKLLAAGEIRGWPWFVGSAGWAGKYEEDRARQFIEAIAASIGDDSGVESLGEALIDEEQHGRGVKLDVKVKYQFDKSGNPKTNAEGQPYTDAEWIPVDQTMEDVAAARAALDELDAAKPKPAPEKPAAKPAAKSGGLGAKPAATQAAAAGPAKKPNLLGKRP